MANLIKFEKLNFNKSLYLILKRFSGNYISFHTLILEKLLLELLNIKLYMYDEQSKKNFCKKWNNFNLERIFEFEDL